MIEANIKKIKYTVDYTNDRYIIFVKVSFFDRLKFLLKGSKMKFCMPLNIPWEESKNE